MQSQLIHTLNTYICNIWRKNQIHLRCYVVLLSRQGVQLNSVPFITRKLQQI